MATINRLPENTYKRIAAGEVIVSPAAAVKELVENALDAGASSITVEIVEGGRDLIRVTDNGWGMSAEDLALCIEKHATSKIASFDEVYALSSLGFRGEALASIAEVSRLRISTREKGAESGSELSVAGGGEPVITEMGLPEGTSVRIDDLFYNVPARRKFLKAAAREAANVSDMMRRLILSRPDVAFKYIRNHRIVYQTPGTGDLRETAAIVYGPEMLRNMADVAFNGRHARVHGIASKPTYVVKSPNRFEFFLNGRAIQSKVLQTAVVQGYQGSILHGHHPVCVLNVETDPASVDINVHPAKLAVLLFQEDDIVRDVTEAVSNAVLRELKPPVVRPSAADSTESLQRQQTFWVNVPRGTPLEAAAARGRSVSAEFQQAADRPQRRPEMTGSPELDSASRTAAAADKTSVDTDDYPTAEFCCTEPEASACEPEPPVQDLRSLTQYRIIGTAFSTYILCEAGDVIYLIDQHAAQERLTYEKLVAGDRQGQKYGQLLLLPVVRTFAEQDHALLMRHRDFLEKLGTAFEPFGELSLRFVSFPVEVAGTDVDRFLDSLIDELKQHGSDALVVRDRIIMQACRHSVKAGTDLTEQEIARLVHEIVTAQSIPHCPHGRPVAVALTKADLEKGFKRRV